MQAAQAVCWQASLSAMGIQSILIQDSIDAVQIDRTLCRKLALKISSARF
jgi:hypothetical protein